MRTLQTLVFVASLYGAAGCAQMDLVGRKLDLASERVTAVKPVYQGELKSSAHIGALVALQFYDGKEFDVSECPASLVPGDVVRIYQHPNGYSAHLWHSSDGL